MLRRNMRFFIIAFIAFGLIIPAFVSSVASSSGSIKVNSTSISIPGQQVQAGGTVNLYFGSVVWSGDQLFLFLSQDGSTQISSGDIVYTPMFSVYYVTSPSPKTIIGDNGNWVLGDNWINGTLPTTLAVGNYYIKAFDQVTSTVAVTDTYVTVNSIIYSSTLNVSPTAGPGGVPITFSGSGYPANSAVRISYLDPSFGTWNYLTSSTANASGKISVDSEVPDLKKSLGTYDYPETYTTVSYRTEIAGVAYSYASYFEYARGLKTIGNLTANGLFGNGTNLVSTVKAMVGDTLALSGKWFHPGVIYVRWDSANVVGTVTSDQWLNAQIIQSTVAGTNGSFSTSIVIPQASAGEHYIAVEDSQTRVIVKIFISSASLQLSPTSGPGGINVQFTGSNYPPLSTVTLSYKDPAFLTWNSWTSTTSDSAGKISISTEMPDLKKSLTTGDISETFSTLSFRTEVNGVPYGYIDFNEYSRGLKVVGTQTAYGLFGNGTAFNNNLLAGNNLIISGKYFHPGDPIYIRFDGTSVVGTVTYDQWRTAQIIGSTAASPTGSFSASVTIPTANSGQHYISIEDSQTWIAIKVNIGPFGNITFPTPTPIVVNPTPPPTSNPTPTPIPTPKPWLPTPTLDFSSKGTTTTNGLRVEINGKLQLNSSALPNMPIVVSYSVTNGASWTSLTSVKTQSDGSFAAIWTPSVTGNYFIKANFEGNPTVNGASKTISLALMPDSGQPNGMKNVFTVNSNSNITALTFNSTSKVLTFTASGASGTTGYVEIYIPKTLIEDISGLKTYIDGNQTAFTTQSQTDSWLVSFNYKHSQHIITLALTQEAQLPITEPEPIPTWLIITIPVAIALGAVVLVSLKRKKN